jgi:hypothetical protein
LNISDIVAVSDGDDHSSALAVDGTANAVANPFPAKTLVDHSILLWPRQEVFISFQSRSAL